MAITLPLCGVWADTASITNEVSASASTGGGGQATSQVEIKTIVNGETVEDINETVSSPAGVSSSIKKSTEIIVPSSSSKTESSATAETAEVPEVNVETGGDDTLEIDTEEPSLISVFFANVWKYVISLFTI